MRFSFASTLVVALAAESAVASSWFSKAAYNKWHETELERWLSDNDVPYPKAADRKELVDLVNKNWEDKVASPYNSWDTNQLSSYLTTQGQKAKKGTEQNKDSLISQVKGYWHETADQASDSYSSIQDWVFDSWTESQLKSFLDYHHIPNPSPRTRDSLLSTARSNYQSAANKIGETAAYPGDWLYQSWSDSDLKAWLDERGVPVPQTGSRDKLIATVRRNARLASNKAASASSTLSSSAAGAQQSLTDKLLNSWSDSQIKEWADKNGIKVPQGSKRNELLALARKHSAKLSGDNVSASASSAYGAASNSASSAYNVAGNSASSAYGAASTSAGNEYAQATNGVYGQAKYWYDYVLAQVGIGSQEAKASLSSASARASSSASSVASVGSNSATSLTNAASGAGGKSASSASGAAAKSASSAFSAASKSASSASKNASKSGKNAAAQATDYAAEGASSVKHAASEAAQKATDRVKEEL